MSIFSSYKKIFLLGFILVILVAIPFSVYVAQKRQNLSSKATASTSLSFEPASSTVKVNDILTLDIWLNPAQGTPVNSVSFVKLSISFEASKFTTVSDSLTPNTSSINKIEEPQYDNAAGTAKISLSIGADPAKAITTKTKIATLKLKAIAASTPTNSSIRFDVNANNTQVLSVASTDQTSENVLDMLSTTTPATVTITAATPTTTLTLTPTSTPTPTRTSTGNGNGTEVSPVPTLTTTGSLSAPVCSSLDVNGPTTGIAPYPLTFTVTGNSPNGIISKISLNFGDTIEDFTTGNGIGTSSVSAQMFHTYNVPGIYTAYATLTDSNNELSAQQTSCTKTITISSAGLSPSPQLNPSLPPPGDGKIIFGLGALGIIITIIGGVLLFL